MTDLRSRLQDFLGRHNTMTLATVGPDGHPRAAAVFYAADDDFRLYFLSSPNSRHCENLLREPRTAATIQADGQAWQEIRGLQIEGTAQLVAGVHETARAAKVYVERFDFLREFLDACRAPADGSDTGGSVALRGALAGSRFYVLRPAWIRLIDNTRGFGHKEEFRVGSTADRKAPGTSARWTRED